MIQLRNIERSYKAGAGQTWVLRRINLEIRAGEFMTIMGPSGAGKSSLLNVLALLDELRIDKVHFCGLSVGGVIGQWLGANAPERLRSLILCNTAAKIGTPESWNKRIADVGTWAGQHGDDAGWQSCFHQNVG